MTMDEIAVFLDDQEKIGKVLGQINNEVEMDNFIVGEVLNANPGEVTVVASEADREENYPSVAASAAMEVQVEVAPRQSNQVCFI